MQQEEGDRTLLSPPHPPHPQPPPNPSIRVTGVEKNTHKRALPSRKAKHKTRRDVRLGPTTNNQQQTTNNKQQTTNNQQPTTNNKQQRSSGASRRAWNAAKWRHVLFSMVLAVFLCFFHLLVSCHFMFFLNFERNFHGTTVSRMSHGAAAKCIFLNVGGSFATVKWHFLPT